MIRRAEKHLQTYPADIRIRNNLAEGLALKGDGKRAMKLLDETLGIAPDNFFARAARCRVAYLWGNSDFFTYGSVRGRLATVIPTAIIFPGWRGSKTSEGRFDAGRNNGACP